MCIPHVLHHDEVDVNDAIHTIKLEINAAGNNGTEVIHFERP